MAGRCMIKPSTMSQRSHCCSGRGFYRPSGAGRSFITAHVGSSRQHRCELGLIDLRLLRSIGRGVLIGARIEGLLKPLRVEYAGLSCRTGE